MLTYREVNSSATPIKLGKLLTVILTQCIDTTKREGCGVSSIVDLENDTEVQILFLKDKRYAHMITVMAYFLTAVTF